MVTGVGDGVWSCHRAGAWGKPDIFSSALPVQGASLRGNPESDLPLSLGRAFSWSL